MTKFNQRRFSVSAPINDAYAENWERTFGKKATPTEDPPIPALPCGCDGVGGPPFAGGYHFRTCPLRQAKIAVARAEIEKWIERLEQIDLPKFRVELIEQYPEILDTDRATREQARNVVKSMKLILKADRITDALARK